jgi:hypothetical protein
VREYVVLEESIIVPISAKLGTNLDILQSKLIQLVASSTDIVIPELSSHLTAIEEDDSSKPNNNSNSNSYSSIASRGTSSRSGGGRTGRFQRMTRKNSESGQESSAAANQSDMFTNVIDTRPATAEVVEWRGEGEGSMSAKGIITDITKSRQHGTMLQVVLRAGKVSV